MKKITFILLGLISGTALAQNSASTTAEVSAVIVEPIGIVAVTNLNFGKIAAGEGSEAGAVRVHPDNSVTYSNPAMKVPSNVVTAATFTISGATGVNYGINIPSISLDGPGDNMDLIFTHNFEDSQNITGTHTDLIVGGLLTVNSNQAAGTYTGTVSVTVSYE